MDTALGGVFDPLDELNSGESLRFASLGHVILTLQSQVLCGITEGTLVGIQNDLGILCRTNTLGNWHDCSPMG